MVSLLLPRLSRPWLLMCGAALALAGNAEAAKENMSYLDNGQIRLGVDLKLGGAITFLADSRDGLNRINSWDWGRQVQMSFYSGPVPFQPPGTTLANNWKGLGWNPIQSGDHYRNGSGFLSHTNDGKTIQVSCRPMIWPLQNVPAECVFRATYQLAGKAVLVTGRLENARSDQTQYAGRGQELPAVYTNGQWYKLVTYRGEQPFTGAPVTTIVDKEPGTGWPWRRFFTTEFWAALVDDNDEGVGVYNAGVHEYAGGFAGRPKGKGGERDGQTGYASPVQAEILDHNIVYEFNYALIVGSVNEIRKWVYAQPRPAALPAWSFKDDRQHWTYQNVTDAGWPIRGELVFRLGKTSATLLSPSTFWKAADAGQLRMEAATDQAVTMNVEIEPYSVHESKDWAQWGEGAKRPPKPALGPLPVQLAGQEQVQTVFVDLRKLAGYEGSMVRVRLNLPAGSGQVRLRSVSLLKGGD